MFILLTRAFSFLLLCACLIHAPLKASCFLIQEGATTLLREGDCAARYSPCSTFKIPLCLMGADTGLITSQDSPRWPYKPGYTTWREIWKKPYTPRSWIKESCVWYSQVLTQALGRKRFETYVHAFDYGNMDLSGDKGQDNGLTNAWLSSSLEISCEEQVMFLEKLTQDALPVSKAAHQLTKSLLFVETLPHGWRLYAKRGAGYLLTKDRAQKLKAGHAWYVGWVEKGARRILFAGHMVDGPGSRSLNLVANQTLARLDVLLKPSNSPYVAEHTYAAHQAPRPPCHLVL